MSYSLVLTLVLNLVESIHTYTEKVGVPPLEPDSRGPFCGRDNKYQFLIQIGTGTYY